MESPQRLHPASPVFEIGRSFFRIVVPGLVVLFLASRNRGEAWYMVAFVPAVVISITRFLTLRYWLTETHLVIQEGLFFRKTRHVPYARIQNLDTLQNPLHRLLGVTEVRIETAGGAEPEAVLRVLSVARLQEIRQGVFAGRDSADDGAGAVSPEPDVAGEDVASAPERSSDAVAERQHAFFRMGPRDVALFGLLSQKGLALFVGLLYAGYEFGLFERVQSRFHFDPEELSAGVPPWVILLSTFGLLLLLQGLTVVWAFVTLFDFNIVRSQGDLRTTCGLWTRQSATIPRHRIQFLSVQEGWLHRLTKRISIRVLTAGGVGHGEAQVGRQWIVPVVARKRLGELVQEVQPELELDAPEWHGVHPRARWRMLARWSLVSSIPALLLARHAIWLGPATLGLLLVPAWFMTAARARRLGYAVTDRAVLMRDGVLTHVRHAVRFSKVQSVSLTQTPFDRRHGTATVHVDTAGSARELSFSLPYVELEEARRLQQRIFDEAASVAFRW